MPDLDAAPFGEPAPSLATRLWTYRWFVLVGTGLLAMALWQVARVLLGPAVVVDEVKRSNLIQTVVASGHIETPYRVDIGSQMTGVVADVLAQEGDEVKAGQVLVRLEASELMAVVVQARGNLQQAEAHMRQLNEMSLPAAKENLIGAEATLNEVQKTFERTANLNDKGFASSSLLDGALKNLELARMQVRMAQLQVYNASPGGSDYVYAETQIAQARATLDSALSRLTYASISAPRDGVLIKRMVERGQVAQPGKALLVLAPHGQIQVVIQLDERNLGLIKLGQSALVSADAYPDQTFAATLAFINPAVDIARASVEVKLNVAEPPPFLRQDMTVSVDIEVARRDQVLIVPAHVVHDGMSRTPWVLGLKDGRAAMKPVRIGARGATAIEVLEGLSEGEAVIPVGAGIVAGQRVRMVRP